MNICDISSFYSEKGGGVRTYHLEKLAYFAEHPEHRYTLIIAGARNEVEEVEGGRVYRVRGFPVSRDAVYRQLWDLRAIHRIINLEQPDVIEIGSAYLDGWLGLLASVGKQIATVGFYHADFPDSYIAPAVSGFPEGMSRPFVKFWREYVRFAYGAFEATCVTSKHIEKKLGTYGLANLIRIPLGVDLERFHPRRRSESLRQSLGVEAGDVLLFFAGRFSTEKGIEPLGEALTRICARPGIKVVLVGTGPLERFLCEKTEELANVTMLGYEDNPERLAALYASADIVLSPGPYETFGLSTLEALASGIPVVAPASGGAGELVAASQGGILFRPHDGKDLARCIDVLLTKDRRELGQRGRGFAEREHSWERTFNIMTNLYGDIVDEKRTRNSVAA